MSMRWLSLTLVSASLTAATCRAENYTITNTATRSYLVFSKQDKEAYVTRSARRDTDLWEVGGRSIQVSFEKFGQASLAVDAKSGGVRISTGPDDGLLTNWLISSRSEEPATIQVAEGKFKGWYLAVSDQAEKRGNAEVFPLTLVREQSDRCLFRFIVIAR